MDTPPVQRPLRRIIFFSLLLLLTSAFSLAALVIPVSTPLTKDPLQPGLVASQDVLAPHALTYQSDILTQEQRERAAGEVQPVYSPPDAPVARRQLERLRAALSYITVVRSDAYASPDQKLSDLANLENIQISQEIGQGILNLSGAGWQAVQQEAIMVLEQVMRTTIREDRLDDARRGVPALISLSMPEDQANIVAELVSGFVAPNSLYNKKQTEAARQQARAAFPPVFRSFAAGETIVTRGSIISNADLEALDAFGLSQPKYRWQDLFSAAVMVLLCMAFLAVYLARNPTLTTGRQSVRGLLLIALLFIVFLTSARLIIPGHTIVPYIFPLAAYSLVIASLFGAELALVSSLPLAILVSYGLPYALELTLYYVLSSFLAVLTLRRALRITNFFWAGMVVAACGLAVVIVYRLPQPSTDWFGLATLAAASLVNGVASISITLVMQFFLAQLMGKTTALQLMEMSRPDHPLLQLLLRSAPGTYQHSLQVANLAEQAAERIGADALLTRVGALYHDVGKAFNPAFFIENQVPGNLNPHDDLDPEMSAAMIIRHVTEGMELARKHRLPRTIQDFILEHHGDSLTGYQYCKAVEANRGEEKDIDKEKFRYPGPRPQTRETALVMLADGCEARVRSERPKDEDELHAIITKVIDTRVADGYLDHTHLTLNDLYVIEDSFMATLRGIYHPRIQYPNLESIRAQAEKTRPVDAQPSLPPAVEPPAVPGPDVQVSSTQT